MLSGDASADEGASAATSPPANRKGAAFVYVIDTSSSMRPIFDEVKNAIKETLKKSTPADSLTIILFGDTATTLASYKTMSDAKREMLCKLLDGVSADCVYTNISLALERGMVHLHSYFVDGEAERYVLVLVTDGKDNPPPDFVKKATIEEELLQFPDFIPGKDWSLRYIYLKGEIEPDLLSVVAKHGGDAFDVEKIAEAAVVTEEEIVAKVIQNPEQWGAFEAQIRDHKGDVKVKKRDEGVWVPVPENSPENVSIGDQIVVGPESKAQLSFGQTGQIGINESSEISLEKMNYNLSGKKMQIRLGLKEGALWNSINTPGDDSLTYEVLTPIALTGVRGTVFMIAIDPQELKQSVAVVAGAVEVSPVEEEASAFEGMKLSAGTYTEFSLDKAPMQLKEIPKELLFQWNRWMKSLVEKKPLSRINFEPVEVTTNTAQIVIGPIKPGKKETRKFPVTLSTEYFGDDHIVAQPLIDLPPGAEMTVEVKNSEDDPLKKEVLVRLDCKLFLKYLGVDEYPGRIVLSCADPGIHFKHEYVSLLVLHRPPTFSDRVRDFSPFKKIALALGMLAAVLSPIWLVWKKRADIPKWRRAGIDYCRDKIVKTRLVHFVRSRPCGQLILRGSDARKKKVYDLADISRSNRQVILEVGSSPSSAIHLPGETVEPLHCWIWASRRRNPTKVFIEAKSYGHLTVNGEHVQNVRQLVDKDTIEIGEATFTFLDTQFRRQAKVHLMSGNTYEGFLEYWDINQSVFYMVEIINDKEIFRVVRFAEVSHVLFYKDESEREREYLPDFSQVGRGKKRKAVTICLSNGRKLKGSVHMKYQHHAGPGVFLLPPAEKSRIEYIYVPHTSIEEIIFSDPA